jgi:hypothetical protein
LAFGEGVGLGGGSGSGTGVAVALGDGEGEAIGLGVAVAEGVACGCPKTCLLFSAESLCSVGWPITKENDKSPVETQNNKTAPAMTIRVFILCLTSPVFGGRGNHHFVKTHRTLKIAPQYCTFNRQLVKL